MPAPEPFRLADRAGAEALVAGILGNMSALQAVLDEEAGHMRAGRLRAGLEVAQPKAELMGAYLKGLEVAKANAVALARLHPKGVEALRAAHRAFMAAVEANQTVLASAKTVCEGLIRSLADDIARSRAPTGYGAARPAPSPYGSAARSAPLVVSRCL